MADYHSSSKPHERTRRDHSSETAEDYVEAIDDILKASGVCRLCDLAEKFGVSNVTVHRIIERLTNEGLVKTEPYKPLYLTRTGQKLADKCRRQHKIVYEFLLSLGIDPQTAAIDAEGIEHHVSPATLACFEQFTKSRQQ